MWHQLVPHFSLCKSERMKRWISFIFLVLFSATACKKNKGGNDVPLPTGPEPVQETAYAFPGAEGFGRNTTGGRGGKVFFVTKTTDDGTVGTLRHAINQTGKRYILFKVSGNIELHSNLVISKGDLTIAGQTAPGDGICLKNYSLVINADNVVIRFMRFRMGDVGAEEGDAMEGRYHKNIIIDHCSMSWSTDECASFYGNENFTLQWCIISESLRNSVHEKGVHGYGGIWGGKNASFHHNLLAHHDSRNPRFDHPGIYSSTQLATMRGVVDFRNNVIYNWGNDASYGGEAGTFNIVNNYYKPGPASSNKRRILNAYKQATVSSPVYGYGSFYIAGNYVEGQSDITADNWIGVDAKSGSVSDKEALKLSAPLPFGFFLSDHTAEEAYVKVREYAGACLKRDSYDQRIVNETSNGTYSSVGSRGSASGLIDSQNDVGGWPALSSILFPQNTSGDGIPDDWKIQVGLDPATYQATGKNLSTAYDNLEVYINSLVKNITETQIQ
jgi:pectate lyase